MLQIVIYYIIFSPINALPFILKRLWRYKWVFLLGIFLFFIIHSCYILFFNPVDDNLKYTRRITYVLWRNERDVLLDNEQKKREDDFYKLIGDIDLVPKGYNIVDLQFFNVAGLAIIINNLGINDELTQEAISLPAEVTLSFSLFSPKLKEYIQIARLRGHDVLIDIPMATKEYESNNYGDVELTPFVSEKEMQKSIKRVFDGLPKGIDGVMNSNGLATRSSLVFLRYFFNELSTKKLIYVDTRFRSGSVKDSGDYLGIDMPYVLDYAYYTGVPFASVDYQLDDPLDPVMINKKINSIDAFLERNRYAVVMTQPYAYVMERLKNFFSNKSTSWHLVKISDLVRTVKVAKSKKVFTFTGGYNAKILR